MKDLWKLKESLYRDSDYYAVDNYKAGDDWKLFVKKGQIAERIVITEEVIDQYCLDNSEIWKTLYVFNNGNYVLSQDDYCDYFIPINKGEKNHAI